MTKKLKTLIGISSVAGVLICLAAVLCAILIKPAPTQLTISVNEISLAVDDVKPIEYDISDETATVSFEIYDPNIVEIVDGNLIGKQVGSTAIRITATTDDERAIATTNIYVTENPDGPITDLPAEIKLYLLDKDIETALAEGYNYQHTFTSYKDYTVVSTGNSVKVSNNTISAHREGETILTFSSKNSNQTQTVTVWVESISPSIANLPENLELNKDERFELSYLITPSYYTGEATVTFKTSSTCIEIEENTIIAKDFGTGEIEVYLNGERAGSIHVLVKSEEEIEIEKVIGGTFEGDTIYAEADVLRIRFSKSGEMSVYCTSGNVSREMDYIVLSDFDDGIIYVSFPELGLEKSFNIVK